MRSHRAVVRAVSRCPVADDDTIVIYERWATGPDFAAHGLRPQPHLQAYGAAIADLVDVTEGAMSVRWLIPVTV